MTRNPEISCACGPREPVSFAQWWRVGVGALIAANSMTVSLAVNTSVTTATEQRAVHGVLFVLALVSLVILGWPLGRNAVQAARRRTLSIEAMFLAGIVGAMTASVVAALTGVGDVYFEIVSILLVVYALGQQLIGQAQTRVLRAVEMWAPDVSRCTVIDEEGHGHEIAVSELKAGQRVLVAPGSMIAADGIVLEGVAFVRESEMTGEPHAVVKRPGDRVWAATHCVDASLVVRATADGTGRRIDAIVAAVEGGRLIPSKLQRRADWLVARFLPIVVLISLMTFTFWSWQKGMVSALFNAMAVLLVACPCALGLATPLAVWAAAGRLASRGLIVLGGETIEKLAAVDTAVFDKTGTLSEDRGSLVDFVVGTGHDRDQVLRWVEAVEATSDHPVARALGGKGGRDVVIRSLQLLPGVGVEATVEDGPTRTVLRLGAAEGLVEPEDPMWQGIRSRLRAGSNGRVIAVVGDGMAIAAAAVDERLRASWPEALDGLRKSGLKVVVMTGDTEVRARLTHADEVLAGLLPEDKLGRVRDLKKQGQSVLFVGDGVNDAAAMAAADVSIGVAEGAELAVEVAEARWHGDDLRTIPWALGVARDAVATIRSNLGIAVVYNVIGIGLAAAGVLHPVAATLLMTCSSLVVTWRAMAVLDREPSSNGSSVAWAASLRGDAAA
jgi:heavy metal translocating P-type ATPase